ncbi:hypothetical protein B0H21DRAFT_160626 [Amylocystis lapponica]|nr:hypothetical protein B0H21DRAFT_160626 [Amylocystis lapponica]
MSTLEFPFRRTLKITVSYTLIRVDDLQDQGHLEIRLPVEVHNGNSTAYRSILYRNGERVAKVICKLAYSKRNLKRLRHEAAIYEGPLKKLQGICVPWFFGLFEGEMEDEELNGCLVTHYCGLQSAIPFYELPWDTKYEVVKSLIRVHLAGVQHGDFNVNNVVFSSRGMPFIIDFDRAEEHKCERGMKINIHGVEPNREDFACDELFDACERLDLWTPRWISFLNIARPLEYAKSAQLLATLAPEDMDAATALNLAEMAVRDYWGMMNRRLKCGERPDCA